MTIFSKILIANRGEIVCRAVTTRKWPEQLHDPTVHD